MLAGILKLHKDLLICDFAEYYHIYDYRQMPPAYIATLAVHLPSSSRVQRALAGIQATQTEILLASIVDRLSWLVWAKTKDAQHNRNKPKSLVEQLTKKPSEQTKAVAIEEYQALRQRHMRKG